MYWALWETGGHNLVAEFDSEREGLQAIHEMLAVNKPGLVDMLVLVAMYDEDEPQGAELPPALTGDALHARLADLLQETTAEASRKVHERIRKWLSEEGWEIQDVADPNKSLNLLVTVENGARANIYQGALSSDRVTIAIRWTFESKFRSEIAALPSKTQVELIKKMYRDSALLDVQFEGFDLPPHDLRYFAFIYFDGLTKDLFVNRIRRVFRAVTLAMWDVARALEDASGTPDVNIRFLHVVRGMGGESATGEPLTVAG
jgi:hypothetical protein